MAVCDENVSLRRYQYIVRLVEDIVTLTSNSSNSQAHQQFSIRAELVNLMSFHAFRVSARVCNPHVARRVHVNAVWPYDHASAETLDDSSLRIYQEYWVDVRGVEAIAVASAPLCCPDVTLASVIDSAGRSPAASIRQFCPGARYRLIGVGNDVGILELGICILKQQGSPNGDTEGDPGRGVHYGSPMFCGSSRCRLYCIPKSMSFFSP